MRFTSTTGADGIPRYTQTTTESENQRRLREGQEGLGIGLNDLASNQIETLDGILGQNFSARRFNSDDVTGGRLDLASALGGFDASRYDPTSLPGFDADMEARTRELATRGLGAEFDRSEESLRSRLANSGITQGSDAFSAELQGFNRDKGDAFARAELAARDTARADRAALTGEMGQGFSQGLTDRSRLLSEVLGERQQNLAEGEADYGRDYAADLADRQVPLQEITSIMSGAPITPLNPGAISTSNINPTDVLGAHQMSYNAQQQNYQQQMAARNALFGSIFGLGGAALGAI